MKTVLIDGKEYKIKFGFGACKNSKCIKDMFKMLTTSYFFKGEMDGKNNLEIVLDGTSNMVAEIPDTTINAWYVGLKDGMKKEMEITEEFAEQLLETYMKDHKCNFRTVFELLKETMEDDGFFIQTGISEMIQEINEDIQKQTEDRPENPEKTKTLKKKPTSKE